MREAQSLIHVVGRRRLQVVRAEDGTFQVCVTWERREGEFRPLATLVLEREELTRLRNVLTSELRRR